MRPRSTTSSHCRRAFTLLEVLVAIMIFGVTMVALASVIHTSVRAWRVGHDMSEITQAAHIAQDVISRDLENLYYQKEQDYNKAFRSQLKTLANQIDQQNGTAGQGSDDSDRGKMGTRHAQRRAAKMKAKSSSGDFTLADVTPPVDLSFHGVSTQGAEGSPAADAGASGGGGNAELSFARVQAARWEGEQETGGIRRVRYYIKDHTLFREETDPYGYRPGMAYQIDDSGDDGGRNRRDSRDGNNNNNSNLGLSMLIPLFANAQRGDGGDSKPAPSDDAGLAEQALEAFPERVIYAEPICEGITRFELKFGYFRDGLWREAGDWDSGQLRYRHAYDPEDVAEDDPVSLGGNGSSLGNSLQQRMIRRQNQRVPDDLPGYVKITLGVVPAESKGREHLYSMMYSIPQSQEDDIYDEDRVDDAGGKSPDETNLGDEPADSQDSSSGSRHRNNGHTKSHRYNQGGSHYSFNRNDGGSSSFNFADSGNGGDWVEPGWGWGSETSY